MATFYLTKEAHERIVREALESRSDPHKVVACYLFGVDADKVTTDMRNYAKQTNYRLLYSSEFLATCDFNKAEKQS